MNNISNSIVPYNFNQNGPIPATATPAEVRTGPRAKKRGRPTKADQIEEVADKIDELTWMIQQVRPEASKAEVLGQLGFIPRLFSDQSQRFRVNELLSVIYGGANHLESIRGDLAKSQDNIEKEKAKKARMEKLAKRFV